MGGISTLEIEKNGISCTKEEAEGRANWLSYVRDKEAGTYSLSLRDNNPQKGDHVKHYRIQMHGGNGFIINKQSVFPMLLWRVCHYQRMVKEEPIEAANENTNLLCPLKKEEELKKTEQNAALGEENTSLPPASNYKTWIAKFFALVCILIAYELKNKWMSFLMFGILFSGANGQGVDVQQKDFMSFTTATSETEVATSPVLTPVDGANYLIFAGDKNYPGSYKCTAEFVTNNRTCIIEVGDKNKTECEGLQIVRNDTHTYLVVHGSKLTHDHTVFCILQQFPGLHSLYPRLVSKKRDQDPDTTDWKFAFEIVVPLLVILLVVILMVIAIFLVIAIKKNFACMPLIRVWWEKISMERVPTRDHDQDQNTTVLHDLESNASTA